MSESEDCHEQYIVTVDYSKSTVDELDVIQGQLVCVIDDSEEGIFYVIYFICYMYYYSYFYYY